MLTQLCAIPLIKATYGVLFISVEMQMGLPTPFNEFVMVYFEAFFGVEKLIILWIGKFHGYNKWKWDGPAG